MYGSTFGFDGECYVRSEMQPQLLTPLSFHTSHHNTFENYNTIQSNWIIFTHTSQRA